MIEAIGAVSAGSFAALWCYVEEARLPCILGIETALSATVETESKEKEGHVKSKPISSNMQEILHERRAMAIHQLCIREPNTSL